MKVLVTGAAGFIGSHIVEEALSRGHEVHGIDNLSTGKSSNVDERCDLVVADIRTADFEELFGKVDAIFHTAAMARIQPSFKNPIDYHSVNVQGTLRLIKYALESNAKLIFSSSSSVYGVQGRLSMPMDESYPLNPSSPYAIQKLFCEKYMDIFSRHDKLRYVALRYFNVYGPRQAREGDYAAVVGIFMNQFKDGKQFTVYGDGKQRRDFTFVKDVAIANLMAMESEVEEGVYNIGSGVNHSIEDIANYVSEENGIQYLAARKGEALESLADYRRAFTDFGWKPETRINIWIKDAVAHS